MQTKSRNITIDWTIFDEYKVIILNYNKRFILNEKATSIGKAEFSGVSKALKAKNYESRKSIM